MIEIEERILELLKDLIIIPSTASDPGALRQAVNLVRNHVDRIPGVRVDEYESGGRPSILARPGAAADLRVLLVGHVDVVEGEAADFRPRIDGERLYGRGAGDMKGQVALMTELFRSFLERHPGAPLGLMITSDEESGGRHGVGYLLNEIGCRADLAILPDSGSLNEIVTMEKGILAGRILSRGRAGHSARPWESDNAAHRLLDNLVRLRERFDAFARRAADHWHHSLSVNILRTRNITMNRIPGTAEAVIDIRFTEEKTADDMLALLDELLDEGTEFKPELVSEPLLTDPDPAFIRITEQVTNRPVRLIRENGGSDGRYFGRLKIPVIMSRPRVGGLHSDDEWIEIPSIMQYYLIVEAYLRERLAPQPGARTAPR